MKIIHCADLHLESRMTSNLSADKARERRSELLETFRRMVEYAAENGIRAVIIAGDMFDTKKATLSARNRVRAAIEGNPGLDFYYLRGNHDADNFLGHSEEIPKNLHLFGAEWTSYELPGGVTVTGAEPDGSEGIYSSLRLDPSKVNIVVMHGQESDQSGPDLVCLRELQNRGIDYLALGHVHFYKEDKLDSRGRYCYPGCLEGRGFDECGEHGFVLLNIDESGRVTSEFVAFARRRLYAPEIDITGCMTTDDIAGRIKLRLSEEGCEPGSLIKLVLTGRVDVECEKNSELLMSRFKDNYYFVKIDDRSTLRVDYEAFMGDVSLKGEFIRAVRAAEGLSDEEKAEIIRCGIHALMGEEIEI
ncbi:MAG: DNA repair exonuclease [Oscillospiraceae bacterium]|nr:DNA repair exonuclease [Oscillospiraceae bacterium]